MAVEASAVAASTANLIRHAFWVGLLGMSTTCEFMKYNRTGSSMYVRMEAEATTRHREKLLTSIVA